MIKLPWK